MLREFSIMLVNTHFFPSVQEKQYLTRQDFQLKMEESSFILLRPHEIRKKYTEFVMANKSRALLPSRTILRPSIKKRDTRE